MSQRRRLAVGLLCACLLPRALSAEVVDYLYVAPSVGGSSGGHVAVRFADRVYHFQHDPSGVLRLARDGYEHFRWAYSVLGNRSLEVARLEVSADTYEGLLTRFNERYLTEEAHVARLASLRDDLRLLRALAPARDEIESPLPLRGAGFFFGSETGPVVESPVAAGLRERMRAAYGPRFLEERMAAVRQALTELTPERTLAAPVLVAAEAYPPARYGFAERWIDLGLQLLALRAVAEARALRPEASIEPPVDAAFTLGPAERQSLAAIRERLATRLVALVESTRPDWGFPLLVGLARLQALERSLHSGRLVVLDAFPTDARTILVPVSGDGTHFVAELRAERQAAFAAARESLVTDDEVDERTIGRLEAAANRFAEVARGVAGGGRIRVHAGTLVPAREAPALRLPAPALDAHTLVRVEAETRDAEARYARALEDAFGYALFTHNCATEVFATIESALGRSGSVERLGGWVDPRGATSFVPVLAFRTVRDTYRVAATGEVASYRTAHLERMYARENRLAVYLRESNTLTSTLYRRTGEEPLFVFFTDDALVFRPVYGAANVAVGLGQALVGLARVPQDRGRTLWSGVRAVASSLPELVFVNLRKGTMQYARGAAPGEPVRLRPLPGTPSDGTLAPTT